MDSDGILGTNWYLQEQLAQQLLELTSALERAIDFNKTLARCVTPRPAILGEKFFKHSSSNGSSISTALAPVERQRPLASTVTVDSELTEPLLNNRSSSKSGTEKKKKEVVVQQATSQERRGSHSLIPSTDDLKRQMAETLRKPTYYVEDFYLKTGFCQALARNPWFQNFTILVIIASTLWLAYDTDNNHAEVLCEAPALFQIVGNFFCCYFASEIFIRLMAFERKLNAFKDGWFLFDSSLVSMIVWETWIQVLLFYWNGGKVLGGSTLGRSANILRVFRIFRLLRIAGMIRMMRQFPEVMVLLKGMVMALRSTAVVLVMMVLVVYIFAIIFTQLLAKEEVGKGSFENVPMSMNFLLCQVVCGFDAAFFSKLLNAGWVYYALFLCYQLIASMTLMNMLIGILCEVVSDVAEVEKEEVFMKEVEFEVGRVMEHLDVDNNRTLSKDEFFELTKNAHMMHSLIDLGVDIVAFVDFAQYIFHDIEVLSFGVFLETLVQFRGSKVATVKDVVDMRKFVSMEVKSLENKLVPLLASE